MIKQFPLFSKLQIQHLDEFRVITSNFEPYSDFNFTSLFCWNSEKPAEVSMLNNNLIIKLADYLTGELIVSILGDTEIDRSLQELLKSNDNLQLVPEVVAKNIKDIKKFNVTEDRDNFDYIYKLSDISLLPGSKFKKKRNKINSAMRAFSDDISTSKFIKIDSKIKGQLEEVLSEWIHNSKQDSKDLESEHQAIGKLLQNARYLNLIITTVSIGNKMVAFSINEMLNNQYAISHFEKAIPVHDQIYSIVISQAAKDLLDKRFSYVNWEQDLGLSGLRKSKLAYHPVKFLKKFSITRS